MSTREIDFVKVSPTQNMTLLVRSEHPVEEYRGIATAIMSAGHVHAEQVGFVRKPTSPGADAGLHMAAGEFCGNACMALAAVTAYEEGLGATGPTDVLLEASGADDVVRCRVERRHPDYFCELAVPLPRRVEPWVVDGGSALVLYEDSLHVVIEAERVDQEAVARHLGSPCPTIDTLLANYEEKLIVATAARAGERFSDAFLVQDFDDDLSMIRAEISGAL